MLIPIETIAVILYLANFTITADSFTFKQKITAFLLTLIICFIFSTLQTVLLSMRKELYSKRSRQLLKIAGINNKIVSTICTIALFNTTAAENIYRYIFPQLHANYILSNICGMAIFILLTLAGWLPWFYIHRRTTSGSWTVISYLLYKFRYTFFILGLWLPGLLISEYFTNNPDVLDNPYFSLYSILFLLSIAWVFPFFLKKFWGCKDLTDTDLKQEIITLAEKAGVNVRQTCSWKLGGNSIPNAAMVGFLPPFRYLFITTGLLRRVNREEILGIVGHELGHLKKHHILFYLIMSISLLSTVEPIIYKYIDNHITAIAVIVSIFAFYIRFIFAWFSRRFEREADLFSAELLEDHRPLCRGLEELGLICGNIRNESSWHHYGIAERVEFLRKSAENPIIKNNFKKNLLLLKTASLVTFAVLIYYSILLPAEEDYTYEPLQITERQHNPAHLFTVSSLLPDDDRALNKLIFQELYKINSGDLSAMEISLAADKAQLYVTAARARVTTKLEKTGYDLLSGAITDIAQKTIEQR